MSFQISFHIKRFCTELTLVRFLSSMNSLMLNYIGWPVKHLAAIPTIVDLLTMLVYGDST